MIHEKIKYTSALAQVSRFATDGTTECHAVVTCTDPLLDYEHQRRAIDDALAQVLESVPDGTVMLKRYYLSDPVNQAQAVKAAGAVSTVGQAPLSQAKLALWAYIVDGMHVEQSSEGLIRASHGGYTHIYITTAARGGEAYSQTLVLFDELCQQLENLGGSLLDNCMRTWLYVRDIDLNYNQMVKGRNDVFALKGLTPETHYIASTGIGAEMEYIDAKVRMDSYSLLGHVPAQVRYLSAPANLNPTMEYGVAFERGTSIDYGDRRHVFISGTASINNRGEIINIGDVTAQGRRAMDNILALLANADCTADDIAEATVYVRDPADYPRVKALMDELLGEIPHVIVIGPVCRPGWLIEIECAAIRPIHTQYPDF